MKNYHEQQNSALPVFGVSVDHLPGQLLNLKVYHLRFARPENGNLFHPFSSKLTDYMSYSNVVVNILILSALTYGCEKIRESECESPTKC